MWLNDSQSAQRRNFLNTIIKWSQLPSSFKLVVTSRDDRLPQSFRHICHCISLDMGDIAGAEAVNDIRIFFESRFGEIAARNRSLLPTWPGVEIIKQLTSQAAGLSFGQI